MSTNLVDRLRTDMYPLSDKFFGYVKRLLVEEGLELEEAIRQGEPSSYLMTGKVMERLVSKMVDVVERTSGGRYNQKQLPIILEDVLCVEAVRSIIHEVSK